ncbi:MAG: hypothetical protein MI806_31135 [Minwuiales bacterium]|nr:hypothetical protein [Minwuiales bacterium]
MATSGRLTIWNGYQEFPSPHLVLSLARLHEGQLAPQYPHLFAYVAVPFYELFGYRGLFLLNGLSYLGVVALCYALARRLFDDRTLALNACLIFILASYAWEYSQAAWPHALTLLTTIGAVYLAFMARDAGTLVRTLSLAALAGLVGGLGIGLRLDAVFVFPALLFLFLFDRPCRPWPAVAIVIGALPTLLVLAAINQAKFGIPSPFTYGASVGGNASGITAYLPLALALAGAGLVVWILTREPIYHRFAARSAPLLLGIAGVVAVAFLVPPVRDAAVRLASGLYFLVADLRIRDPLIVEGGLTRSPTGGMIYIGSLKKSLLQSCPYLVILALPLVRLLRGRSDAMTLAGLFAVPVTFILVYGYFHWHGGQGLNLRYLLPVLPFGAILTAYAWRELYAGLPPGWRQAVQLSGIGLFVAYALLVAAGPMSIGVQEHVYLSVPMAIAAVGLALTAAVSAFRISPSANLKGACAVAVTLGFVWAGLVGFTYDLPRSAGWRAMGVSLAEMFDPVVEPDSLLFVRNPDPFFGLLTDKQVRLALPDNDRMAGVRALADFHLDAGRPVYAWLDPDFAEVAEDRGLFAGLTEVTLLETEWGPLVRLVRNGDGSG